MSETAPSPLDAIRSTLVRSDPRAPTAEPAVPGGVAERRYERHTTLGQGGMGRVDQARDRDLLRDVAVKVLRPELTGDAAMLDQFLWEARVTAHLDHPNVVPVHDVGRFEDGVFFTMKLVRGETLAQAAPKLTLTQRLRAFLQICNAVAYAHSKGVLHRDLKPSNVMLGEFGEVLVTDWGLALPLDSEAGRSIGALMPASLAAMPAGTPAYMSPEQARGEALDARSDIYSLGVVLYELVANAIPFDGTSAPEVMARVARGEARSLRERVPEVPASLEAVVRQAMALEPPARYATASELAQDVERHLDGFATRAEKASTATRFRRYYFATDRRISNLRVVDIDLMVVGGILVGLGAGGLAYAGLRSLWWLALVAGALFGVPPVRRWFGSPRDEAR